MDSENKYKDALERARKLLETSAVYDRFTIEQIFPELKESEDERIRKALLEMVHDTTGDELWVDYNVHKEDALAWLEKQGNSNSQNWKPSKEQINALEHFVRSIAESGYASPYDDNTKLLKSLINDLHKLEKQKDTNALIQEASEKAYTEGMRVERKHWLEKQGESTLIEEIKRRKELYSREKEKAVLFAEKLSLGGRIAVLEELLVFANEKQGEQKPILDFKASNWYVSKVDGKIHDLTYNPADKTQPRFKVGDWVVKGNVIAQILDVQEQYYIGLDTEGNDFTASRFLSDDKIHLWTIQDAKDGDVLAAEDKDKVFVYNGKLDLRGRVCAYCGIYKTYDGVRFTECAIGNYFTYKEPHPATKEQRDLLSKKMREAKKINSYCQKNCKGFQETGKCFADWDCKAKREAESTKAEFKIEKGKWYVCTRDLFDSYANKVFCEGDTYLSTQDGSLIPSNSNVPFEVACPGEYFRDWTIQDAKDGDVLAEDSCIFIIKKLNQDLSAKVYCCLHDDGDFEINSTLGFDNTSTYPATKEQRDLLFQKMKEAGCEFDFEKKELKKIDQKPTYMIKPKFKVGDWIVDKSGLAQQVLDFRGGIYTCTYSSFTTGCESNYHLWTIDNARDGDVLADGNFVGLFKENNYNPSDESGCTCFYCSFDMDNNKFYTESGGYNPTYLYPATKEQEELLFQKMKEAGCKFDFEKKELRKIDPWYTPKYKVGDTVYYSSFGEIKSMVVANVVIDSTDNPMYEDENGSAIFEKAIIEQKPAWSEEDERNASYICAALDCYYRLREERNNTNGQEDLDNARNWLYNKLKSLRPQNNIIDEELAQAKKNAYNDALDKIEYRSGEPTFDDGWSAAIWYLKKRNTMPKSQWKPSEEQMHDLRLAIDSFTFESDYLQELYEDLKKIAE